MGDTEIPSDFRIKLDQLKTNLGSWTILEWILFFVIIPGSPRDDQPPSPGNQGFVFYLKHRRDLEIADLVSEQLYAFRDLSPSGE